MPSRLCTIPMPCQLAGANETARPAARNGKTSQFGIRQLRRSVTVATPRTAIVGHHASECNRTPKSNRIHEKTVLCMPLSPQFTISQDVLIQCDTQKLRGAGRGGRFRLPTPLTRQAFIAPHLEERCLLQARAQTAGFRSGFGGGPDVRSSSRAKSCSFSILIVPACAVSTPETCSLRS